MIICRLAKQRRSSDLSINGNLHYPNDKDRSLNETSDDKILKYRVDYNNNPPISTVFMTAIAITSGRLHSEFIRLLFLEAHRETDRFLKLQEFNLRNRTVEPSTSSARPSWGSSKQR